MYESGCAFTPRINYVVSVAITVLLQLNYDCYTGLPIWLDFENLAFFQHFWLFLEIKKSRKNLAFFSQKGLALAKHYLSCIFITNLFR